VPAKSTNALKASAIAWTNNDSVQSNVNAYMDYVRTFILRDQRSKKYPQKMFFLQSEAAMVQRKVTSASPHAITISVERFYLCKNDCPDNDFTSMIYFITVIGIS
jgi:hypothetical protein